MGARLVLARERGSGHSARADTRVVPSPRSQLFTTRTLVPRLFNRAYALFLSFDVSDLNQPELIEMLTTADQKGRRVEMRVDPEPFELATLASAHEKCETNHSDGKIVVRVTADPSSWPEVGTGS